jgi:hypothetical protein
VRDRWIGWDVRSQ